MPKIDWSASVMPFVEKYGKKFYDKFMQLPDYIKGHMNPKEKEVFIKEGKPAIKRYTVGDEHINNNFVNGRGRNPRLFDGVYTSTAPLGYDIGYYGDYQFKLPWSRDEFSNRPRLVAESDRLEDVVQVDALDRHDPQHSERPTFVTGPIKRRELYQKEAPGYKLADATGLAVPNGNPVSLAQKIEHTTDFGGRTDVFDRVPPENMFLDSLATKSGRSAMKQARFEEIASGLKNGTRGFGFANDVFPIRNYFDNPWNRIDPKVADAVNNTLSEKYGSISNMLAAVKRNPSEYEATLNDVTNSLIVRLDAGEHDILPYFEQMSESERHDAVRNAVNQYASFAFTNRFNPSHLADYGDYDDLVKLTTYPKRIDKQLKLIDDIEKHADVPNRETATSAEYTDNTRRLGNRALNEFGYVPEYFSVYERGQNAGNKSGTMRFLLPDEPDRPVFKGERLLDFEGIDAAFDRAMDRQFKQAHYVPHVPERKFGESRTIGELLTHMLENPHDKTNIANVVNALQLSNDATTETNRKFDELAKRLYEYAADVLESKGVNIDDDIARELSYFVNERIDLYRKDHSLLPDSSPFTSTDKWELPEY